MFEKFKIPVIFSLLVVATTWQLIYFWPKQPTMAQKKEQTISILNTIADNWNGDEKTPELNSAIDPWGHPIQAVVKKESYFYTLEVWSNGPDGLQKNSDDLIVTRTKQHKEILPTVNKELEKTSSSISSGIIQGIRKGLKNEK